MKPSFGSSQGSLLTAGAIAFRGERGTGEALFKTLRSSTFKCRPRGPPRGAVLVPHEKSSNGGRMGGPLIIKPIYTLVSRGYLNETKQNLSPWN